MSILPSNQQKVSKCAVIVETRWIKNLNWIIKNHLKYLDKDWGLTIFHSNKNLQLINEFKEANLINLQKEISKKEYNDLLKSVSFWEQLPYDKILIFQHDSRILKKGINAFLSWDYVGGPWRRPYVGGNGGFSLRTRNVMIDIIKKFNKTKLNEDRYFSQHLTDVGANYAPRKICFKFSCETIFALGTLGYHAIDKYLIKSKCDLIKNQYRKMVKII